MNLSAGPTATQLPIPKFAVGVTGHRAAHASFPKNPSDLSDVIQGIFSLIEASLAKSNAADHSPRLLTLLSDGTDHLAAGLALDREWELVVPLPFGRRLNTAINSGASDPGTVRSILAGKTPDDPRTKAKVAAIEALANRGAIFELADNDARVEELLLNAVALNADQTAHDELAAATALRAALAGQILIEQSDVLVAVWDGQSTANIGGTGHTALMALEQGAPVLWIDPTQPNEWQILSSPEELSGGRVPLDQSAVHTRLDQLVAETSTPLDEKTSAMLADLELRKQSSLKSHAFRRVQVLFGERGIGRKLGSIRQRYEQPSEVSQGMSEPVLKALASLTPKDDRLSQRITSQIIERHIWLDGIASDYSDRHRSGMVLNFLLGAGAIIMGVSYLPVVDPSYKWIFASIELVLLLVIVVNTAIGRRRELHTRWFETRRAAEYLRHTPILAALGVARSKGEWPQTIENAWPERYVQHVARAVSLPQARVDEAYLRTALKALRTHHIEEQRQYHKYKAEYLERVHHGLDHLSERLFVGAIVMVATFLALTAAGHLGWISEAFVAGSAKWFTVLAVALPTLGGAFAGIRYFGDFERFADISKVTAAKLDAIAERIDLSLNAPEGAVTYDKVADLAKATDQIVFDEIQSWQSVFSSKIMTVPA
ncbi:hypothetical protein EH31_13105 [Erythrobacter longus]|uniref:SMODS and SLOG-associating 2TM effector domain-containing protein n=1 Tax=Erythrobacter longus TaxID=1044 RepID=A0A074M365_ERYLO|nr:hypothetical protein [Erythrobacter longus]KEO88981.1 hypothetical protein EH31_13105 [Erythrobacter longus]